MSSTRNDGGAAAGRPSTRAGAASGRLSTVTRLGRRVGLSKLSAATVACLLSAGIGTPAALATGADRNVSVQPIAALLTGHTVHVRANAHSKSVAFVNDSRPLTGSRTVLPVLAQATDAYGRSWLEVRLPGRATGGQAPPPTGWIRASNTVLSMDAWHIVVHLSARRLYLYHDGRLMRSYPAIVGKPSTPTPTGQYFVEEDEILDAGQPGGPYALASSDRSKVLQEFDGGPGQIAIHGLEGLGGQLGTAESHGCVRLADSAITWLAARIEPGTPITIS